MFLSVEYPGFSIIYVNQAVEFQNDTFMGFFVVVILVLDSPSQYIENVAKKPEKTTTTACAIHLTCCSYAFVSYLFLYLTSLLKLL